MKLFTKKQKQYFIQGLIDFKYKDYVDEEGNKTYSDLNTILINGYQNKFNYSVNKQDILQKDEIVQYIKEQSSKNEIVLYAYIKNYLIQISIFKTPIINNDFEYNIQINSFSNYNNRPISNLQFYLECFLQLTEHFFIENFNASTILD